MVQLDIKQDLDFLLKTAHLAGQKILEIYETDFNVEYKSDNTPLTEADKKSNDVILEALMKRFPEIAVLSEEFEDDKSRLDKDWCWIIDPLDGTKEFLKKNGEFTVNIGLAYQQKTVLGIVYVPVTNEFYYAYQGGGAFCKTKNEEIMIKVSDKIDQITLMKSRSHPSEKLQQMIDQNKQKISKIISSGSSIKGCLIASGKAEVYYRFGPTMEWDTAAMQCVVEEAGGIFRQLDGSEMLYNRMNSVNEKGFFILNRKDNEMFNSY